MHRGIVARRHAAPDRFGWHAGAAPIFGWFEAHVGWGTAPAIMLPFVAWATSCVWAFSLAMIDGWQRGFAGRLADKDEYLAQVPDITDIPKTLHTFSSRILDFQPNSWVTHVSGHPPGALLTFVLAGPRWPGRRRVGRIAVPAGRVEHGCCNRDRAANSGRRVDRATCRAVRRRCADGDLGSRSPPTGTSSGSPPGASPCWRWRYTALFDSRRWSRPQRGCCSAGRCSSATA